MGEGAGRGGGRAPGLRERLQRPVATQVGDGEPEQLAGEILPFHHVRVRDPNPNPAADHLLERLRIPNLHGDLRRGALEAGRQPAQPALRDGTWSVDHESCAPQVDGVGPPLQRQGMVARDHGYEMGFRQRLHL